MDGEITNNSYWKSTGILGQRGVCDMVTHDGSSFHASFRFRTETSSPTAFMINVDRYGGIDNLREWNIAIIGSRLYCYLFGTNNGNTADSGITLMESNYNDGLWHSIDIVWASNGVGSGGLFTYTVDGVEATSVTDIDTINLTGLPLNFNGRVNGGNPAYPCAFDLDYFEVANTRFNFSSCWGDKIYSTDGTKFVQLYNQTYATVWNQDDDATPHNFNNGFYLYENGNAGEELRYPIELDIADIPAGYTYSGYYPPLVFGDMESGFKIPYNALVAAADTEGKLYDGETPKEIKFSDLVAGGFGNKIKYLGTVAEGFRKFCVKK